MMTHEELDALDDMIELAIDKVCRRAGGENGNPPPRWVREAFKEAGLKIVSAEAPASEAEIRADERQNCWRLVNAMVHHGSLTGDGRDAVAQRNGLILAANVLYRHADAADQALEPPKVPE